ncbi:MAG: hypothetical protein AAF911_05640 [Planctomycetota bacterium]
MEPQTPANSDSNLWLGVLGVVVIVGFAMLAVFDTSLRTPPAQAAASPAAAVSAEAEGPVAGSPDNPIPLYASEAGAHGPAPTSPASPSGVPGAGAPGAEATSLFDTH